MCKSAFRRPKASKKNPNGLHFYMFLGSRYGPTILDGQSCGSKATLNSSFSGRSKYSLHTWSPRDHINIKPFKPHTYIYIYIYIHVYMYRLYTHVYATPLKTYPLRVPFSTPPSLCLVMVHVYICIYTYIHSFVHTYIHTYIYM